MPEMGVRRFRSLFNFGREETFSFIFRATSTGERIGIEDAEGQVLVALPH